MIQLAENFGRGLSIPYGFYMPRSTTGTGSTILRAFNSIWILCERGEAAPQPGGAAFNSIWILFHVAFERDSVIVALLSIPYGFYRRRIAVSSWQEVDRLVYLSIPYGFYV